MGGQNLSKNRFLSYRTARDIDKRVERVLKGLGDPEPPLRLDEVRELLKLDRGFYTAEGSFVKLSAEFAWRALKRICVRHFYSRLSRNYRSRHYTFRIGDGFFLTDRCPN